MASALAEACSADAAARAKAEEELDEKMLLLKRFAEAMNEVAATLHRFLLIRSGSIKGDLKELKSWVSQKEADEVHMQLERFRDDATEEKVTRRLKMRRHI